MKHDTDKHTQEEYYQLSQYICRYDAEQRAVSCQPFVRTFLQQGRAFTEVTPSVNQGGRLPVALPVKTAVEPVTVNIGGTNAPS
ncbi:hypothetical protein JCM8547_007442 [Rhodosporidiobolus lusitaniae]